MKGIYSHEENLPIMLALCSMLLHNDYAHFKASIVHTPPSNVTPENGASLKGIPWTHPLLLSN